MEIKPIAFFRSPLTSKFGVPRQSGLASALRGSIVLEPEYRREEALAGLEGFDYVWLIWHFSANGPSRGHQLTVRPPRLGGNRRMGVFATRSPFRPNALGLSCVHLDAITADERLGPVVHVSGADLMDGTPIFDIKPYVPYADSHEGARSGFVDATGWEPLGVTIPPQVASRLEPQQVEALRQVLAQDPRPRYHDDAQRVYGMPYAGHDIHFTVDGRHLTVISLS